MASNLKWNFSSLAKGRSGGVLLFCALIFLLGTIFIARHTDIFISPDETATQFFTRAFSTTGSYRVLDRVNETFGGLLHPRSVVTDGIFLLPGGFLGLSTIYSFFVFFFGAWVLTFLTPMIAIAAVFAWMKLLEQWFSKRVAIVSAIVLLFHPAFWYYASRGLMPNVLFASLLIFGAFFMTRSPSPFEGEGRGEVSCNVLSGLCFGLALFVRLAEVYWVLPLIIFLLFTMRSPSPFEGEGRGEWLHSVRDLILFFVSFSIPLLLMFFLNAQTYGHPFAFGYTFVSSSQNVIAVATQDDTIPDRLSWLFPFGFHPRAIFWHTLDYLLLLFWWLTIPTFAALPMVFRNKKQKGYVIVTVLMAIWLCIWYGSWRLNDNPDPTQITIANSYVRYWLPLFVLSTPFIASSFVWISERVQSLSSPVKGRLGGVSLCLLLLIMGILNVRIVFFAGQDALIRVEQTLQDSKWIRAQVFDLTPSDAIIIVDRADKLFFPFRHVIYPLRSETTYAAMPDLVDRAPLYYYGVTLPQKDLDFLNQTKLSPLRMRIDFIHPFGVESLYRLTRS